MKIIRNLLAIPFHINNIYMKVSEIKQIIADAAADTKEALGEIGTKVAALQQKIDELIAGNSDPDVDDAVFAANLASLKDDAQALADIVPAPTPPVDPAPPVEEPVTPPTE